MISRLEAVRKHYKNHPVPKRATDSLIIDFCNDFPTVVEYGSFAIADVINSGDEQRYATTIQTLSKKTQKKLRDRMAFLLASRVYCTPLKESSIQVGLRLLSEFTRNNNLKDNFRNSLNDILILAVALEEGAHLITEDSVLNRFAAQTSGIPVKLVGQNLELDFSATEESTRRVQRESKGFVNRRWSVMERRGRSFQTSV